MQDILHIIVQGGQQVMTFLGNVPAEYYAVIFASLPFSMLIAFVKTFVMRKWDATPSETKMFLTNFGGLALMSVAAYLSTTPNTDPWVAVGSLVGITSVFQQPFFYKVVKPMVASFWRQWDAGKALHGDLTSAAVPKSGLPIDVQ